jgi:DNA transformation protein
VDAERLGELFAGLGPIRTRAMFGGLGVYCDGAMFALVADGVLYLKAEAALADRYAAAGSVPFTYAGKSRPVRMSYWRLPDSAFDDPDEALGWARPSLALARAAAAKRRR